MRLLLEILHPAHVHFFRPFCEAMTARGHEFLILSRDKDVTLSLLDAWGIEHICTSRQQVGRAKLGVELLLRSAAIVSHARHFKPDVIAGLMGPSIALSMAAQKRRAVVFYDNETTARLNAFVARVCDGWLSPRAYRLDHGQRHQRYDGYHELTYLHPNRFRPDRQKVVRAGINPDDPYSLVRFVGWQSIHDRGESGFSLVGKRMAVERLARMGRVFISSEGPLPADLEPLRLKAPVEDMHHVIAFARCVVGESSTVASEAACLGTPAIFVSRSGRGVNDEQEDRYGLVRNFNGGREADALACVTEWAADPMLKQRLGRNHSRLLAETVDVTGFMVDYFENGEAAAPKARVAA